MKGIMEWQLEQLNQHLSNHKYYLGESGIQLDENELEKDFIEKHLNKVAKEMRIDFCTNHCSISDCELRNLFIKESKRSNSD